MTLDDFLRALESLIDDRDSSDDQPGEGNFGCEECRACNHCRFCIGCDSCEDCTYCEECIDCTSGTQSKRCVSCQKVSYCEDSRDCKNSRYLTLCVSCNDCVHCLACVGLEGAEFYVLNEKRTRKEYFAVLRQVQELMANRMHAGWRPPSIGLASDIVDPLVAGRDAELTAAPWLDDSRDGELEDDEEPETRRATRIRDEWPAAREGSGREEQARVRGHVEEPAPTSGPDRRRGRDGGRDLEFPMRREASISSPPLPEPREAGRDWIREPPEFGSSYGDREDERTRPRPRRPGPRADYGADLGRELEDSWSRDLGRDRDRESGRGDSSRIRESERGDSGREPGREPGRSRAPERSYEPERTPSRDHDRERGHDRDPYDDFDAPRQHEQQPTKPFARERQREREPDDDFYDDPRAARGPDSSARVREQSDFDDLGPDSPPARRDHEASSPWLDDDQAQARRVAKRGSLRRAGRPQRPDEPPKTGRDATGTGSAPERTDGTHTGTGLRLGRKPKRR